MRVTPLRKGTKGKIRPITIGATIKRFSLSAILKAEKNIQQIVCPQELAIGRKAALEDLKRTVDAAIAKTKENLGRPSSSSWNARAPVTGRRDRQR